MESKSGRHLAARHLADQFVLPAFTRIKPVSAQDSSWEVDALAETEEHEAERWAVEVKWRNRRADYHDIARFYSITLDLHARGWFIAKTGLTVAAAEFARERGLMVSTERDLQALAERLGVRFGR